MKTSEITALIKQFDGYFENFMEDINRDTEKSTLKIDVLIYSPTKKFKFWKLITMGASDYSMSKIKAPEIKNKEYVLLVDKDVRFFINNSESLWYLSFLRNAARTIKNKKLSISLYDVIEVEFEDGQTCYATFLPIKVIEGTTKCKLSTFKDCEFMQLIPLSLEQAKQVQKHGEKWCLETFYPDISEGNEFFARKPIDFVTKETD